LQLKRIDRFKVLCQSEKWKIQPCTDFMQITKIRTNERCFYLWTDILVCQREDTHTHTHVFPIDKNIHKKRI